jgi:drug/metabolite transporter (DMT)-like permease
VRTVVQGVVLAAHWAFMFAALQRAPIGTVVLIIYVAPVILAVVAPPLLGERLTRRVVVALALGFAGSALLLGPGADGVEPTGLVYALIAALLLVGLLLNAKVLSPEYGGLRLALAQLSIASLVLVPIALSSAARWPSGGDLGWLVVLGLVHTALALAIYLGSLAHMPVIHSGVLLYLEPASAAVLGWLVLGETLDAGTVVGGLLVVAGGLLVLGGSSRVRGELAGVPR